MGFELLVGVSTDEEGDFWISDDVEDDANLWFDQAFVQLGRVVAASVKSVLRLDVFEDGFLAVKEDELDVFGPFVFDRKDTRHFDEDAGGGAAVVDSQEFELGKELGVEVGAEQEGRGGIPVGIGIR